jgi:hypothetical protein
MCCVNRYRLISQLPIVEVWDASAQSEGKKHPSSRAFISVSAAVKRKEIFHSDGTANVWMKKGRSRRSLVLSREGPQDQFNAGVVALLQACAESIMRDSARGVKADFPGASSLPNLSDMEIVVDDPPTKTLALAQKYRTRCVRDDLYVDTKTFMLKKRPKSATILSQREYPKPWLVGADLGDDEPSERRPSTASTDGGAPSNREGMRRSGGTARPQTAPPTTRARARSPRPVTAGRRRESRPPLVNSPNPVATDKSTIFTVDSSRSHAVDETWPTLHRLCAKGNPNSVRHNVRGAEQAEAQSLESAHMTPLVVAAGFGHLQVRFLIIATVICS